MKTLIIAVTGLALAITIAGCSKEKSAATSKAASKTAAQTAKADTVAKPRFVQPLPPGNIRASHILISYAGVPQTSATRTKEQAKQLADSLLARVKNGENFAELARTYSDCPSAEAGGDLGFFPKGRMVRPFDTAAFALRPGQVSGVVETPFGYHIIERTQ